MEKINLLVISESEYSFIAARVIQMIKARKKIGVLYAPLKIEEIDKQGKEAQMLLLCCHNEIGQNQEEMIFLKDRIEETECMFAAVGYQEELDSVFKVLDESKVTACFKRPLNLNNMVDDIERLMEKEAKGERKKHILIVDDNGMSLRTTKSWLSSKYKVSMAGSATMAISFLARSKPDLILLDYAMPICDGPQFMEMIHAEADTSKIPVMFLSAKEDSESVEAAMALKPAGYLLKSSTPEQILEAIDQFFINEKVTTMGK